MIKNNISTRKGALVRTATNYNSNRAKLAAMHVDGTAPPGAALPNEIDLDSILDLDLDSHAIVDIAFDWDPCNGRAPDWMTNSKLKQAIRADLLKRRCQEESDWLRLRLNATTQWLLARENELNLIKFWSERQ
jgi:hypothetical protein